ncbi:nitrite/sulfite reductase [Miltoncostaea oceani]|uniref:nitrite/sulfite reductase n=1 Tax=Miltoncostaea oceani TaxID=2843216 RepID=UPI001C3C7457|nr:nitrite/sulfite reductase [Miltoncostaea oceani]
MSTTEWRERLLERMPPELAEEIDIFEGQMELRRKGKIEDRVFAETRLRRGVYGQRYDNGHRHDGLASRELVYPAGDLTKGPETLWDAPGMVRIKVPYGGITPEQLDVIAELAEEYSDSILHITTRQDVQLHYVHIDDTPDLMRRLASVDITTREACGNGVRNLTACPLAGVCHTEAFDTTAYAAALFRFLLGHPDCQDFGRKFKPAFSGCAGEACGLVMMHDFGAIARTSIVDGVERRSFDLYVGGGLGTTPHQAKLLYEDHPVEELLPAVQSIARVFGRLGEKANRNRARIKFLVAKLGIDEFRRLVDEERKVLPHDDRWTSYLPSVEDYTESPVREAVPAPANGAPLPDGYREWLRTNVYRQRQPGYAVATVALPLGDLSSTQTRQLADVARKYVGDAVRTTVEQNIVLRWVAEGDLPALYEDLVAIDLAAPGAGTIVDVTSCPGTDTCKLGIASSRGLAGELRTRLAAKQFELDEAVRGLRIKVSGCFNSCGQHHVADIGFFGNSRKINGVTVPHFQVVLGGRWRENAGSYGLAIGSVPSKRIPEVVDAITTRFVTEREGEESFQDWIARLGKKELGAMIGELKTVPPVDEDPSFYTDWGDARVFTMGDMGIGECAGEVISSTDLELTMAESIAFDAQVALEDGDLARADERAYAAMVAGARALVRTEHPNVPDDPDTIVREFRTRFYDTERFFDRFAKGRFARPLFDRHEAGSPAEHQDEATRSLVEESQLFIDAVHAMEIREAGAQSALV